MCAGAGKTHTMLGTDKDPGIMVQALNDLFLEMEKGSADLAYKVTMSYLEVCIRGCVFGRWWCAGSQDDQGGIVWCSYLHTVE